MPEITKCGFEDHHGQLRSARRARMALQFPSIMDMVLDSTRNSSLLRIQSSGYIGSNESLWDYAESPAIPSEIFWGSSCYLILVGSFGIASNLTVLVVFLTHKKVQTPFNLVLMNLIMAELLISLIGIPIDLTASLLHGWKLGYHLCLVTGFSMTLLGMVSIFTLSSLAIQRWLLVTRPGKFSPNNWTHTRLNLALIWSLSLAVALPPLLGWSFYAPETSGLSCAPAWEDPSSINFNWYMLTLGFFLPTSAMVYTSGSVILNLNMNASNQKAASVIRRSAQKRENKVTRMVMFMITSFTICWFPYALMCLYRILIGPTTPLMSVFPLLFAKSSICWNPIIYILMNNQFNVLLIPKFLRNFSSEEGSQTTNHHNPKIPTMRNKFLAPTPLIGSLSGQTYDISSKEKRTDSQTQPHDTNFEQIGSIKITFTQPWKDATKNGDLDSTEAVQGDDSIYRNKTTIARIQYTSNFKEDTRF